MSSLKDKVLKLKFDATDFHKGLKNVLNGVQDLHKALKFPEATRGVQNVADNLKREVSPAMDTLMEKVEGAASKFDVLTIAAGGFVASLTTRAFDKVLSTLNNFTFAPIAQGFSEYELKLGSVQTILANTQRSGTTIDQVTTALGVLNEYADKTIYNFADMTKHIGLFTAAGVNLDDSVAAIKGLSNVAAVSGADAESASRAMYQMSQAMNNPAIRLMDWRSMVNAGMANKEFEDRLIANARKMGKNVDAAIKKKGSFQESLSEDWLTTDVFLETLNQYAGAWDEATLKSRGYTDEQIKDITELGRRATAAASDVKSFTQLLATVGEAVGSGWAETWEIIFGDLHEAKALWGGVYRHIEGYVDAMTDARNNALREWKEMGGRQALLEGIANIWFVIERPIVAVARAFAQAFGGSGWAVALTAISKGLRDITSLFVLTENGMNTITAIVGVLLIPFRLLWSGIKIVIRLIWAVASGITRIVASVAGLIGGAGGGLIRWFYNVINAAVTWIENMKWIDTLLGRIESGFNYLATSVEQGTKAIWDFMTALAARIDFKQFIAMGVIVKALVDKVVIQVLPALIKMKAVLTDFAAKLHGVLKQTVVDALSGVNVIGPKVESAKKKVNDFITYFNSIDLSPYIKEVDRVVEKMRAFLNDLVGDGSTIYSFALKTVESVKSIGLATTNVFDVIKKVGAFLYENIIAPIPDAIKRTTEGMGKLNKDVGALLEKLNVDHLLTGIATLAAAIWGFRKYLAWMKGDKIFSWRDLIARLDDMGEHVSKVLESTSKAINSFALEIKSKVLVNVAVALGVLAASIYLLSLVDPGAIPGTLVLLTGAITTIVIAIKKIETIKATDAAGLMIAVVSISVAMYILAKAVRQLASLETEGAITAAASISVLMTILLISLRKMGENEIDKNVIKAGATLILMGVALRLLASTVKKLGEMEPAKAMKGIAAVAALLVVSTLFSKFSSTQLDLTKGLSLVLMAYALRTFSKVIGDFANYDWSTYLQSVSKMTILLAMITTSVRIMGPGSVAAAVMLIGLGVSMALFGRHIVKFAEIPWSTVLYGATVLSLVLGILVVALNAIKTTTSALPALVSLSISVGLLAMAMSALAILPVKGLLAATAAIAVLAFTLVKIGGMATTVAPGLFVLSGVLMALGVAAILFGIGLLKVSLALGALAAIGTASFGVITVGLTTLIGLIPILMVALANGLIKMLGVFINNLPTLTSALAALVQAMVKVLIDNMPHMVALMITMLDGLLQALIEATPMIAETFAQMLMSLLDKIIEHGPTIIDKFFTMLVLMIDGLTAKIPEFANSMTNMITAMLDALTSNLPRIASSAVDLISAFLRSLGRETPRMASAAADMILEFINGVADTIRSKGPEIGAAAANLGLAIIEGILGALSEGASRIWEKLKSMAWEGWETFKKTLGIASPSKVFYEGSKWVPRAIVLAFEHGGKDTNRAARGMAEKSISGAKSALERGIDEIRSMDLSPAIVPVVDLTEFERGMDKMSGYTNAIDTSIAATSRTAATFTNGFATPNVPVAQNNGSVVNFTQNNYSPKALSSAEIYRQTRNQLSIAKNRG